MSELMCGFCLTITQEENPTSCVCKVVRCLGCGSWNKEGSKWCHGCGTIKPKLEPRIVRTTSTACIYVEDEWLKRNKGAKSTGDWFISSGLARDGSSKISSWLSKWVEEKREDVMELTDEEKKFLQEE